MVLPYPENNILDNSNSDKIASFPMFGNRIITEETNYEVIKHSSDYHYLALRVESYKEEKLYTNFKYGTPSRTFASIEFFSSGYYVGSCFMTKPKQICQPDNVSLHTAFFASGMLASVAIPLVSAAGFVPSAWLVSKAPTASDPNSGDSMVSVRWVSFIVKPSPDVILRVVYP